MMAAALSTSAFNSAETSDAAFGVTPAGRETGGFADLARDDFERNVWSVLGIPVDVETIASSVAKIESAARAGRRLAFVTPNVNMLCQSVRDGAARADILDHDLSLADGAPIVLIARLLGMPLNERVAGSDVFEGLKDLPAVRGRRLRVFFFGGRDGAADAAAAALNARQYGIEAVGSLNPGFGSLDEMSRDAIIDAINAARPDMVVVALGSARGNAWITRNAARLTAPVISHLGAVVDFTAGTIRRAPKFMRRHGLEAVWRIFAEPSLWRRYWHDGRALAQLMATCVLPLTVSSAISSTLSRGRQTGKPADARFEPATMTISLSGDCVADAGDLSALRAACRDSLKPGRDVVLDLTDAGAIDASCLGIILMLEKHLARMNRHILVTGLSKAQQRIFRRHNMNYDAVPHRDTTTGTRDAIADQAQSA